LRHYLELPSDTDEQSSTVKHLIYLKLDGTKGYIPSEDLESAVPHYSEEKRLFRLSLLLQTDDQAKRETIRKFCVFL
jgi:hypothetical protein